MMTLEETKDHTYVRLSCATRRWAPLSSSKRSWYSFLVEACYSEPINSLAFKPGNREGVN